MIKAHNLKYLEKAMAHPEIVRLVEKSSEAIWHRLPDVTSFEHTCYVNIGKELIRSEVESIEGMARHYIQRAKARHLKKTSYESPNYLSNLSIYNQEDNEEVEYEVEDVLANVESIVIEEAEKKEMAVLLAKGDHRRKLVVSAWMNGQTNDLELSDTLARVLGGKKQSHRKFIQRFRDSCRTQLGTVI